MRKPVCLFGRTILLVITLFLVILVPKPVYSAPEQTAGADAASAEPAAAPAEAPVETSADTASVAEPGVPSPEAVPDATQIRNETALTPAEKLTEPDSVSGLWIVDVFRKGGPVMWPILICSVMALAIAIERGIRLQRKKIIHPEFLKEVRSYWVAREFEKALKVCMLHDIAISRIVKAGLLKSNIDILEVERAVESTGNHEAQKLMSNLRGLGVLANLAPMLGLLGTVTGMIKAFNVISQSGTGNPGLVASGIAEALITTAAGLIVGIPALAAYHYFRGRVDRLVFEMEEISMKFVEEITYSIQTGQPIESDF